MATFHCTFERLCRRKALCPLTIAPFLPLLSTGNFGLIICLRTCSTLATADCAASKFVGIARFSTNAPELCPETRAIVSALRSAELVAQHTSRFHHASLDANPPEWLGRADRLGLDRRRTGSRSLDIAGRQPAQARPHARPTLAGIRAAAFVRSRSRPPMAAIGAHHRGRYLTGRNSPAPPSPCPRGSRGCRRRREPFARRIDAGRGRAPRMGARLRRRPLPDGLPPSPRSRARKNRSAHRAPHPAPRPPACGRYRQP